MTSKSASVSLFVAILVLATVTSAQPRDAEPNMPALLALYELTTQALAEITWDARLEDQPALVTALEVVRRIPRQTKLDWQRDDVDWWEAARNPEPLRGELALVQGRLRQITAIPLPNYAQDRLGTSDVFQCEIELAGSDSARATLLALQVPTRLLAPDTERAELDQRVSATAIIVNSSIAKNESRQLLLVAEQIAWHPDAENVDLGVTAADVWLANQGVDISALEDVRDDAPLAAVDRTAFYQLLAAAHRWDDNRLATAKPQTANITKLLRNPQQHRARLFTLRGTARRAISILVDEPDISSIYGLERYHEVEVFVDAEMPILVKSGDIERQFNRYPVVFCCRELPEGMPSGETINEPVEITGAYLKTWAYPSAWITQQTGRKDQLQISPLLIGRSPKWLAAGPAPLSFLERYGGWLFVVALASLAAFVAWTARGDRRAKRAFRQRFGPQDSVNLDQMELKPPPECSSD